MKVRADRPTRLRRTSLPRRRRAIRRDLLDSRRAPARAWIAIHPPDLLELVAHELRTPVTSLYGAAQLLDRNTVGAWARTDLVAEMAQESSRLVRFLEDLLALADASAGAIHVEPVLVQRILELALSRVRGDHPQVPFIVRVGRDVGPAVADPEALRHALGNLLGHAARAAVDGQGVWVQLVRDGDRVVVTVRERLLRPSHPDDMLDRGDSMVEPGGRLWLASAQALVQAMGGDLHVSRRGDHRLMKLMLGAVVPPED